MQGKKEKALVPVIIVILMLRFFLMLKKPRESVCSPGETNYLTLYNHGRKRFHAKHYTSFLLEAKYGKKQNKRIEELERRLS